MGGLVNWLASIGVINWWHRKLYQHGDVWGEDCFPRVGVDDVPSLCSVAILASSWVLSGVRN